MPIEENYFISIEVENIDKIDEEDKKNWKSLPRMQFYKRKRRKR